MQTSHPSQQRRVYDNSIIGQVDPPPGFLHNRIIFRPQNSLGCGKATKHNILTKETDAHSVYFFSYTHSKPLFTVSFCKIVIQTLVLENVKSN